MLKFERIVFFLLASVLFCYLALRTSLVSILSDEALSFLAYMRPGTFFPFAKSHHISANNHFLNSLLGWVSYNLLGTKAWIIRLPNLLSFLLYSWSIYKIGSYLKTLPTRWLFWCLSLGAHFILEFFAYARGYGIGLAFFAASIQSLLQHAETGNQKHLYRSLWYQIAASLANLNLLLSLFIWGVVAIKPIYKMSKNHILKFTLTYIAASTVLILWSFQLRGSGELYLGESNLHNSFLSLLISITGFHAELLVWFEAFLILSTIVAAIFVFRDKLLAVNGLALFFYLFVFNIAAVVFLGAFLNIPYPVGRTTLHWYFLLSGLIPFMLDYLNKTFRIIGVAVCALLLFPIVMHSIAGANLCCSTDATWRHEHISDQIIPTIIHENKVENKTLSLTTSAEFYNYSLAFNSLQHNHHMQACDAFQGWSPIYLSDLLIVDPKQYPEVTNTYVSIFDDTLSGQNLYKRKQLVTKKLLHDSSFVINTAINQSFTQLMQISSLPDSSLSKPIQVDYKLVTPARFNPMPAIITLEMRDSASEITHYRQIRVDYFYDQSINDTLKFSIITSSVPATTTSLRSYFWNIDSESFSFEFAQSRLFELVDPLKTDSQPSTYTNAPE